MARQTRRGRASDLNAHGKVSFVLCLKEFHDLTDTFQDRLAELYPSPWHLTLHASYRQVGLCSYVERRVFLSVHFLNRLPAASMLDTVRHEMAHALAGPGTNHGVAWRHWCAKTGANPERCLDLPVEAMSHLPWKLVCSACGHVFRYLAARGRRRRQLQHSRCGPQGILVYERNPCPTSPTTC